MKLRIDDITAEARELELVEPEHEINLALARGPLREYQLQAPIRVALNYYRAGTDVFVGGNLAAAALASCSRCAEEFQLTRERGFRYVLAPKVIGEDKELALKADDLEFSVYQGDEIELSPLIREQVLLALAAPPLCQETCRGLCPRCGTNLNESDCACTNDFPDERLAVLRSLKVGR